TSNTPAMRLEQNNSGGFTAQTWDVAGNEANFFVRDVTGGSRLPFRIRPGAPTSSVDISADGDVGIGTASPSNSLHVLRSDGTAKILVQESNGTTVARELIKMQNNGDPFLIFNNSNTASTWSNGLQGGSFVILDQADVQTEFILTGAGNLTVSGTVTPMSSREVKQAFDGVDNNTVLGRVLAMPITTWAYKADPSVRHMGPMAEDFFSAFNLGADNKGISVTDSAGVAFAAIQGLYHEVEQKNAALTARNAELEGRLATLEKMVQELAAKKN
ncbi:MAG TPA: tail fiber domain-containing protein, partial [Thermoanaerobaculia bacterium]|nr:tail fiber domain-containing protein [Thermoanaerobaculia bacterium]